MTSSAKLADFQTFLGEIGATQEQMDAAKKTLPTPIDVAGDRAHHVQPSTIEGLGVFSGNPFKQGDQVCTLTMGDKWTTCGRYINHSPQPNIRAAAGRHGLIGVALRSIDEGDELTLDYRQCMGAFTDCLRSTHGVFRERESIPAHQ